MCLPPESKPFGEWQKSKKPFVILAVWGLGEITIERQLQIYTHSHFVSALAKPEAESVQRSINVCLFLPSFISEWTNDYERCFYYTNYAHISKSPLVSKTMTVIIKVSRKGRKLFIEFGCVPTNLQTLLHLIQPPTPRNVNYYPHRDKKSI